MIGYVTLGTNNIDKARAFYAAVLAVIGGKEIMRFPSGFTMYGAGRDKPTLGITTPFDKKPATAGNGTMISLTAGSRANVDAIYAKAIALGAKDEGKPGVRGEEGDKAFYGAYFRDLDGNKLCAFHVGPKA